MPQDVKDPNYLMGHIYAIEQAIKVLAKFLPEDRYYQVLHHRFEEFRVLVLNSQTSEASIDGFDDAVVQLEVR